MGKNIVGTTSIISLDQPMRLKAKKLSENAYFMSPLRWKYSSIGLTAVDGEAGGAPKE